VKNPFLEGELEMQREEGFWCFMGEHEETSLRELVVRIKLG
jgi:hypothetical protein